MQTRNKMLDDLAQLMTNAAGVAQGMRSEAETAMRSLFERWMSEANLVSREEFDAVRDMAVKAREENERLEARIAELEARLKAAQPGKTGGGKTGGSQAGGSQAGGGKAGPKRTTH